MAQAITALEPDRPCQFTPGSTAVLIPETEICPLTLGVPALENACFDHCADREGLRDRVTRQWSIPSCDCGDLWLPIVWTAKGPLYAEVIQAQEGAYQQPYHLKDKQRQPLYRFAFGLLDQLQALPAVYMLAIQWQDGGQERGQDEGFAFDRLLPFPNESAIASVGVQSPDLFACHWHCLMGQPIQDVQIRGV